MKHRRTIGHWGWAVWLIAALIGCGLGCQQATSNTGRATTPTKSNKQPENKDQPGKQPKPDVG